ncbi:transporter [Lacibacter luteus]|uniref:Transporter n=1 Tax=Lacibacter luteus TaxID=2508719 RepID=A0A4Q1CKH5_9BACT|nr:transporter [Lacibacter luteus]RXK60878.1 transporter [Lacibacter luteus]
MELTKKFLGLILFCTAVIQASAQTDIDAIMMEKNAFCVGPGYAYSSWKNYWEGTKKRENLNLGTVSTQMFAVMGNYGVTKKLNALFNVPYVVTKASVGTLRGQRGMQDLSLMLKYRAINQKIGDSRVALIGLLGGSLPISNYTADLLPLSIGMQSKTAMARLMLDYQYDNKWFATASATYVWRSKVTLDRDSYYTDRFILSNEVDMPNATSYNIRAGYRTQWLIAEAVLNNWTTKGGFDITQNNMPFISNRMNATSLGFNVKYVFKKMPQLSLTGGASQVVAGRNMGQSFSANGAVFYVFNLNKKEKKA